ncbi:MAG TPA: ABC transporter substrate-binding protein [Casimicrobiaceae bacterium]|nr:ABC transporter substrate-binding protein [Casimicrobiaceae bacterium]
MKRRTFITLLGGAAVAWPIAVHAQQPAMRIRRIGALIGFAETDSYGQASAHAFRQGLEQLGWVEGRNIRVDYRFAAGDPALYKTYADELVGLRPDAILAGATPAVAVLQPMTRTIPIVFVLTADPVGQGFVQSLARPGGNITGFGVYVAPMMGKWLGLFKEIAPGLRHVAVIFNPDNASFAKSFNQAIEAAAQSLGVSVTLAPVHDDAAIEAAVAAQAQQSGGGVIVLPDSFVITHRKTIIAAAARYRLPTFGMNDLFPRDGGLMSYSIDSLDTYRQGASYIDRILKGANPADLPIQEPTKFLLILNVKTAKELGLDIPVHLQQLADEVIE